MTLDLVEPSSPAIAALEGMLDARWPDNAHWPSRAHRRAFCASLDRIGERPGAPLGRPHHDHAQAHHRGLRRLPRWPPDGVVEVGYGVEDGWQRNGLASEATKAQVDWALEPEGVDAVQATTPPWHVASIRVLERAGLARVGTEEHESLGEVVRFERRR